MGLQKYNGKWITVDHTIISTLMRSAEKGSSKQNVVPPTPEQIQDASTRVQSVNKQYLFTTDKTHAVLTEDQFFGQANTEWPHRVLLQSRI